MALMLVTGRANAGKTRVLHEATEAAIGAGKRPTLLVPTLPDARRLEREFARKSLQGVRVGVLDTWFSALWLLHGDGRRLVTDPVRRALVNRAVDEAHLRTTRASSDYAGFRALVVRLVRRVTAFRELPDLVPASVESEIVVVLKHYGQLLSDHGLVEPAEAMMVVAAHAPRLPGPVALNRFIDLSAAQEALVVGLGACNDVIVALTWENGHPATSSASGLVQRLAAQGDHRPMHGSPQAENELELLEQDLFRPGATIRPTGMVRLVSASGPEDEVALVAAELRRLVAQGLTPDQVAVAFRDPSRRFHLLGDLVRQAGVPIRFEVLVPLATLPFGAALLALLDATRGTGQGRESLLAFLASPYSGASADEVARADIRWRRERLQGRTLLAAATRLSGRAGTSITRARALVGNGGELQTTYGKWEELADGFLSAARGTRAPGTVGAALDIACHGGALSAVQALADVGDKDLSRGELIEILKESRIPVTIGDERDAVIVTEVHRLHARRFEALIVGGLSAKEFSPDRAQSLTHELAGSLGVATGPDEHEAERLLFYSLVTRAKKQLVLIDPTAIPGDDRARPSAFIDDVMDLYRTCEERVAGNPPSSGPPGRDSQEGALQTTCINNHPLNPRGHGSGKTLADGATLEMLAQKIEFSVSEVETYLACPYRWFVQHVVTARSPDSALGPAEIGSLAHGALADFYHVWHVKRGRLRVTVDTVEEALGVYDEVWSARQAGMCVRDLGERFSLERMHAHTRALVEDDATFLPGFFPREHEFRFGERHDRPFEFGGCRLRGSIDRIDVGSGGAVVTDYKFGAAVKSHTRFAPDGLLQPQVYAAAAGHFLEVPVVGTVYRSLTSLKVRGAWIPSRVDLASRSSRNDSVDETTLAALIEQAEEQVARAVDGMRAGQIGRHGSSSGCGHCSVAAVCDEEVRAWRPS